MTIASLRRQSKLRFEVKHRASLPGYEWPIRWEHERGDASDETRAGALRAEPASRSQAQPLVSIAGGRK